MKLSNLISAMCLSVLALQCAAQTLPQALFSIGEFEIGSATVADIQFRFGVNKPRPIEPSDGSDIALCYSNSKSSSAPAVVFESGALGGWKEITAYRLTKRGKRYCRLTNIPLAMMSTVNGLRLGARRQLVERILREAKPRTTGTSMLVEEAYRRRPTASEAARLRRLRVDPQVEFDVIDIVEVRFENDIVRDLYVKRLVSY
jgi:hypothetical protein